MLVIGEFFVSTHVQCPEGDLAFGHPLKDFTVDQSLRFFTGKFIPDNEGELTSVEADTFCLVIRCSFNVAERLFGAFLAWAVVDRISMKRRTQRPIPGAPPSKANDLIAVVVGLALYVAFVLWLHTWLIGISPIG